MIVTAHQPNYLPGLSVLRKVAAADAVVWLDCVRFTQGGYVNRNELPNGQTLAVPIKRESMRGELRDVQIIDFERWNRDHARSLERYYHDAEFFHAGAGLISTLKNAWRLGDKLVDLNFVCLQNMLAGLQLEPLQHRQQDFVFEGATISDKLADMVGLLGGSTYLSGPSGHRYLDLEPFRRRRIRVEYHEHRGPNPSAVDAMFRAGRLP